MFSEQIIFLLEPLFLASVVAYTTRGKHTLIVTVPLACGSSGVATIGTKKKKRNNSKIQYTLISYIYYINTPHMPTSYDYLLFLIDYISYVA